jgi:predicted Zn-dependent peptidase
MYKLNKVCRVIAVIFIFGSLSWAGQQPDELPFPVKQITLKNGLRIILSEDNSLPIVSVVMAYHVGSIHEKQGKTGMAHLLQNLMFQGSRNVGQMQHYTFIQKIGGTLNAITMDDKTLFYQTVPSNQLALVLWLESDRMQTLNISPSNVANIKNQLVEDIQRQKESDPYLENSWYFDQLLFPVFAYSHPILGTIPDISKITTKDVLEFFTTYYSPNNAVLTIVGHFEEQKVIPMVQRYFSTIPGRAAPPALDLGELPKLENVDRTIKNTEASSPGFYLGYQLAPRDSDDHYRLAIVEYALLKGRTSRMFRRLVEKDKTAIALRGGIETRGSHSVLKMFVRANNDITNERNRRAVLAEINKIKTDFIGDEELYKIKNLYKMDYFKQFATVLDKAIFLTDEILDWGSLTQWVNELDRYLAVSHYDVSRAANKYLNEEKVFIKIETK